MLQIQRTCLVLAGLAFVAFLGGLCAVDSSLWKTTAIACSIATAIGLGSIPALSGFQFTAWIVAAVLSAMLYPGVFLQLGPIDLGFVSLPAIDLKNNWLILVIVQLVMFGMGTKMGLRDFAGVVKMPYPIFVGISLQFLIMPLTGYLLAILFGFPPEIAAGVVLIGESLFILSGAIAFALFYHWAAERFGWLAGQMHVLSMFGIIYFTLITTAAGRDHLLVAGAALFLAAVLHNFTGYSLGYGLSRLVGLDRQSALTVAFEVGMQNGGMAAGLAGLMGKLGTVGLAAAVFSPWMNVSGSVLANLIRRHRRRSNPACAIPP